MRTLSAPMPTETDERSIEWRVDLSPVEKVRLELSFTGYGDSDIIHEITGSARRLDGKRGQAQHTKHIS
jgi:hypothetical protein